MFAIFIALLIGTAVIGILLYQGREQPAGMVRTWLWLGLGIVGTCAIALGGFIALFFI
jgi:hypothetical protein